MSIRTNTSRTLRTVAAVSVAAIIAAACGSDESAVVEPELLHSQRPLIQPRQVFRNQRPRQPAHKRQRNLLARRGQQRMVPTRL